MKHVLIVILFALFVLEGTVLKWAIPAAWQTDVIVSPQMTLIVILYIGLYADRHSALFYGLGIGLLHDINYAYPMIGTYTFTMGLIGYLAGLVALRPNSGILVSLFVVSAGNLLFEGIVYGLYRMFRITHTGMHWVFFHQMLPSLLMDMLFALIIYVPIRKLLERLPAAAKADDE